MWERRLPTQEQLFLVVVVLAELAVETIDSGFGVADDRSQFLKVPGLQQCGCLVIRRLHHPALDEDASERTVPGHRIVTGRDEDLDADVVSAGVEVRGESGLDVFGCAVEYQGIDEPIAATVGHVLGSEPVAEEVVDIVA
jgi:hypothetical protein